MERENFKFYNVIKEQIEVRYGRTHNSVYGLYDTYAPLKAINNDFMGTSFKMFSPNISKICGGKPISLKEAFEIADVNMSEVRRNLETIKKKGTHMVQIGYGGFGINTLYFISELAKMCGIHQPFQKLVIYENDTLTFMNAFRIYKDLTEISVTRNLDSINKLDIFVSEENLSSTIIKKKQYFTEDELSRYKDKTFFVGAPDFATRKILENSRFLFTGHAGNEFDIYGRPVVNQNIGNETYGNINIVYFFINMIKASEYLIDIMANIEEVPADTEIVSFNSEEFMREKLGSSF